jgi:hypothetical protein
MMRDAVPRFVLPPHLKDAVRDTPPAPNFDRMPFWDDPPPKWEFERVFGALTLMAFVAFLLVFVGACAWIWWLW